MRLPSRDHLKESTVFFPLVSFAASPPLTVSNQICCESSRSERNASACPSGDQRGIDSDLADEVHWRSSRCARS